MMHRMLLIGIFFLPQFLYSQKATVTEESREIATYPYNDPNPIPILTERNRRIYPYHSFDGYSTISRPQQWKVVKLENEYIEVYILPEAGGKVWGAIEKSTGKEFIYRNEVMKFRNIALRGPWTSGGIEFNFGFIGHTPSTSSPVDYLTRENSDGSVSCFVGTMDLPSRTQWRVEIRLPKDKAYFETNVLWNNPTPLPQSYYNWMTGAAVVTNDLEFFYPGNRELGHDGLAGSWPVDKEGRDLSKYSNNAFGTDRSSHVVGEYNDFMGGYYHNAHFGFGHWALYDEMPGRKLWLWAQSRSGGIWEDLLTDHDGQYMEFQAGRTFNQYAPSVSLKSPITQLSFGPGLTDCWKDIWFPVKEIGGLRDVSPSGVMNVFIENGELRVGINALAFSQTNISVTSHGITLFSEERQFKPMEVFQTSVKLTDTADYEVVAGGMDLRYSSQKKNLINRPFVRTLPEDDTSAAALYHEGTEQKENRNYKVAKDFFLKCLNKDSQCIEAMAALTELYYRSNRFDSALYYANKAMQIDTYDPSANYFAGITYRAEGDFINALETLGWAARSPEYRSAAYAQMAGVEMQINNLTLAEHYATQSLIYNSLNFNALKNKAIIYRLRGQSDLAESVLKNILSLDPLQHFADFERYLLHPSPENLALFTTTIKNEFPYQTYLEVAIDYYGLGQKEDALQVLEKAPANPLVDVWKAFLKNEPLLLDNVTKESPAFVFPYRTETLRALEWAVSKNNHWKFNYYLGLAYWAVQREEDAKKRFMACGNDPDFSTFYLERAYLEKSEDANSELNDLLTAKRIAPEDWRSWNRLIDYYDNSSDYQKVLSISEEAMKRFSGNSTIALQHAKALLSNGRYTDCIKILEKIQVLPFERSTQGKVIFEQACLFMALDLINSNRFEKALSILKKSREWPENLGVGKPYEPDTRIQDYLEIFCLGKLNRLHETAALQKSMLSYTEHHYAEPSFNTLLAFLILNDNKEKEKATALIQKLMHSPQAANPVQRWVVERYNNGQMAASNLDSGFDKNMYFKLLKKTLQVTNRR